jgi:hypothetical protein
MEIIQFLLEFTVVTVLIAAAGCSLDTNFVVHRRKSVALLLLETVAKAGRFAYTPAP